MELVDSNMNLVESFELPLLSTKPHSLYGRSRPSLHSIPSEKVPMMKLIRLLVDLINLNLDKNLLLSPLFYLISFQND